MQTWIFFVFIAQFIWAICSLIDKNVISKGYLTNPLVYIILNGVSNLSLFLLLPFFHFSPLSLMDFLAALASSALAFVGVILYYEAVKYEEISRITMLYPFTPLFVIILSFFFLNESLSMYRLFGFALLIAAGLIAAYHKSKKMFRLNKSFYLMIGSTFSIAIAYITAKHVFTVTDFWSGVLWLRLTGFSAFLVLIIPSVRRDFARTFKNMKNKIKGLLGFKVTIDAAAFVISDYAILLGPVSLVAALSNAAAPLFTFTLALIATFYLPDFVREDTHKENIEAKLIALL
ncbi:MAG: EamA family transporter, partial [Nanoarchaeota archaeon]